LFGEKGSLLLSLAAGMTEELKESSKKRRLVVIVDDDPGVCDSTSVLLELAGYEVESFESGSALVEEGVPRGAHAILLDLMMPGLNGLETLEAIGRQALPPVIMLTGHGDIPLAVEAMKLGAVDFLEKPYPADKLLELISSIQPKPVEPAGDPAREAALARVESLTPRQREVLKGVASGEPSKVTAHKLELSVRTVEAYRSHLFARLGVRGTADAVRIAVLAGLVSD
jgi:two-component system response regulator FixJ